MKFTQWENYRTKTDYEDALIYKVFLFEFVNSYGSLFYLAFFRQVCVSLSLNKKLLNLSFIFILHKKNPIDLLSDWFIWTWTRVPGFMRRKQLYGFTHHSSSRRTAYQSVTFIFIRCDLAVKRIFCLNFSEIVSYMSVFLSLIGLIIKKIRNKFENREQMKTNKRNKSLSPKADKLKKLNEKVVLNYVRVEKNKPNSDSAISTEYTQKVILYGYLMV